MKQATGIETASFLTRPHRWHCEQVLFALGLLALCQIAQAVRPAPDGGYPGGNTAEGQAALFSLTTGTYNTAVGVFSLQSNATGTFNTAIGAGTLLANTADENTATGAGALLNNTGFRNTANGAFALFNNTTGNVSTAIGDAALVNNTTGTNNIAIGFAAGNNVITADDVICIGSGGANVSSSCFIDNIRNVQTANGDAVPVLIDSAGQLGTASSSRRFKKEITPMNKASEAILSLKPVTFQYKSDARGMAQFGLIAEEVGEVDPNLVVRDKDGEIYSVRYDAVNAMLLNEFLKEHRKVEEQQATIAELKSTVSQQQKSFAQQEAQIQALASGLRNVSAQVEISKPTPKVVVNTP